MSEPVAIASVVTSGLVGLGGLGSAVWSAARERKWKTREERTIDLRSALQDATESFGRAMFLNSQAYKGIELYGQIGADSGELGEARRKAVIAGNHIGLRCGSRSDEYLTFLDCTTRLTLLYDMVDNFANNGIPPDGHRPSWACKQKPSRPNAHTSTRQRSGSTSRRAVNVAAKRSPCCAKPSRRGL
jgi:hypothetical protein